MGDVHDLLLKEGATVARAYAPGRRGPRVVEAASRWLSDEDISTGFVYSGWCQTGLPHRKPVTESLVWKVQTDALTLLVEPGFRVGTTGAPTPVGVPYGAIARLILIYLQSEALRTGSREVELGGSLRAFLKRLSSSIGGKTAKIVKDQADRLSRCRLTFHSTRNGVGLLVNQNIVDCAMFVESDSLEDGQGSLFVEKARLSEVFFQQLTHHAVPLDEAAIRHIRNSSMALDVYCWLAYRLHALRGPKHLTWAALAGQFGMGIKQRKHFRAAFTESLSLALAVYPDARVDLAPDGIVLRPSNPPVRKLTAVVG
ncbi:MAG: plasmid replication initiator [Acetobacteraceae bacterium]|nr:plasmid replication initiator [Acetobacteraceae bacterium]